MYHDTQISTVEGGNNTSHLPFNSPQYETNAVSPQLYNIPPPNMYIPPYLHYSGNSAPNFTANQYTNTLVPPYPPPDIQNIPFSTPNYVPLPQHQPLVNMPPSLQLNVQSQYNSQETFVNTIFSNEFETQTFQKKGMSNDVLWIQNWLSVRNGISEGISPEKPVKISEVKENFKRCINLLQELEKLKEDMSAGCEYLNFTTWNSLCQNFIDRKNKVDEYILNLADSKHLQNSIKKRQRKREHKKRRNKRRKEKKTIENENRQVLHHKIDSWQKEMQETIDRNKREESLKKEADSVLSEVLRKKADGRRQLALVEALLKLRQLRVKSAANRGQHVLKDDGVRFEKVAENLKALWNKQLLEYNVEEQGMRVMLSEAVDERDQSQVSRERQIFSQWDKLLFGTKPCDFPEFYSAAERSIEAFINTRQTWDKFIVSNTASMQSNIPIGWILPSNPSSSDWESLLSSEKLEG